MKTIIFNGQMVMNSGVGEQEGEMMIVVYGKMQILKSGNFFMDLKNSARFTLAKDKF
jgi:hypothetical protein